MLKLDRPRAALSALAVGATVFMIQAVALAAPRPETGIGLPFDASKDGHHIDWLIKITGVFTAILFVITVGWILYACLKHNRDHKAEYDHGDSKHHIKVALTLSAVIFFVVDGNLWVDSTLDVTERFWNFAHADQAPGRLRVEVNGHQWAWDMRYEGTDGKFGTPDDVVILNDMPVPVDSPVILQLGSVDVIHSFSLPNMRVKADAVPGHINKLWFHPVKLGDYDIACTQHCGQNHYKMKAMLRVLPRAEFDAWLAHASKLAEKAYDPDDTSAHWAWEWKESR